MFQIAIRKILHNSWMFAVLLLASIIAVATICSVPLYTSGILQRLLWRDLEELQSSRAIYPGRCYANFNFHHPKNPDDSFPIYKSLHREINENLIPELRLPVVTQTHQLTAGYLFFFRDGFPQDAAQRRIARVESLSGLEDHIKITHGKMFSKEKNNDVYEVIITEGAMQELNLLLDRTYVFKKKFGAVEDYFKVKVVGVFTVKEEFDPFWFNHFSSYNESFIVDYSLFTRDFVEKEIPELKASQWFFALDYHHITLKNITSIMSLMDSYVRSAKSFHVTLDIPFKPILEQYEIRAQVLQMTLWFLQIPTLCMLALFIYMISLNIVENEKNEIAVLKSRGARNSQILFLYFVVSLILSVGAFVLGPPLGLFICRVIGSSNGFLEFIQRKALPVSLDFKAYLYSFAGIFLFVVTMLIPVLISSRSTIVEYKKTKARSGNTPAWKKFFFDIILILISIYGLYRYYDRQKVLSLTGAEGSSLPLDPLLFLVSVFFMLGAGLFFIRIFPYFIKLIFAVGRNKWSPVLYASLIQVGRSHGTGQIRMIFLILSLSLGIYNSMAARTININIEERIRYMNGADITINSEWQTVSISSGGSSSASGDSGTTGTGGTGTSIGVNSVYIEPDFKPYTELVGAEMVTKVFKKDKVTALLPNSDGTVVQLMAIIPHEFGDIAWFRSDLLPYHWYQYLNLLSESPKAFLVSKSLKERYELEEGDQISLAWANQGYLDGYIYAFIDFWPSFNPFPESQGQRKPDLIVANLHYIHAKMFIEPYEIWLRKKPDTTSNEIFQDIEEKKLDIVNLTNSSRQIIDKKNDPMLQGTNGTLTVGFFIIMLATVVGFIVYLILSFKSRLLQFGVFRAMGLSQRKVTRLFIYEQLFISGTAIVIGILIGNLTSNLFIPILQLVDSAAEQVPPFRIVALRSDFLKLYLIVAAMLAIGIAVFRVLTSKIKIHQVIKLGEE